MHPLFEKLTSNFDETFAELQKRVESKHINTQVIGDLHLFDYSHNTMFENFWDVYTLSSRGLILDVKNKKVVALPFPKFFNHNEVSNTVIPNLPFSVTEKMDGSLGIIWYHGGKWNVSTRGSMKSDQAIWANEWLNNQNLDWLSKNVTYLSEIIYRNNQVVVSYDFEGLVFLSGFNNLTGYELTRAQLRAMCVVSDFKIVDEHSYPSIDSLINVAKTLSSNKEGFVVRFENGHRVKIKGDEYIRVHRLVSGVTPVRVWEMIYNGDNLTAVRNQLPDEIIVDFDNIVKIINDRYNAIMNEIQTEYNKISHLSDKELGLYLKNDSNLPEIIRGNMFPLRKNLNVKQRVLSHIYPKSNHLAGYVPSRLLNSVQQES